MLLIQESANLTCMEECEEKYNTADNGWDQSGECRSDTKTFEDVET